MRLNVFGLRCFALYFALLGIFCLFKINIKDLFTSHRSIKSNAKKAKAGKKNRIGRYCSESVQILRLLRVKNPENMLAAIAFGCAMLGIILGSALNNIPLSILFAIIGLALPFCAIQFIWSLRDQKISEALEIALTRITSSYMRPGMTFEDALKENLKEIPDAVRPIFETILLQTTYVDADIVKALRESKLGIHNSIYKEWVNAVIRCQGNQTLKPTLPHIVNKFTEQRIIIGEVKVLMQEPRRSFFIMTGAAVLSPFLLYLIQREWFSLLLTSAIGKVLLAILVICIAVSLFIGIPALTPNYNLGNNIDDLEE